MADTDKLVEQLSSLSVLEIAGLVKQLEEKWGVSAAAMRKWCATVSASKRRKYSGSMRSMKSSRISCGTSRTIGDKSCSKVARSVALMKWQYTRSDGSLCVCEAASIMPRHDRNREA